MSKVEVLCPSGHRVSINVLQTTKIIKVLEEACLRRGYMPYYDYEIRHGRKTLELSVSIQETGLPNHAKLELVKRQKPWMESKVLVQLQTSEGLRMQRDFMPNISLFELLENFEEDDGRGGHAKLLYHKEKSFHPVLIFVKEEIISEYALKETTLKSLGIISGRVLLRHVYREVMQETLNNIADDIHKEKMRFNKLREKLNEMEEQSAAMESMEETELCHGCPSMLVTENVVSNEPLPYDRTETFQEDVHSQPTSKRSRKPEYQVMDYRPQFVDFKFPKETLGQDLYHNKLSDFNKAELQPCDRELTAYRLDEPGTADGPNEELPDNFFEVTETDIAILQRDLEQNVKRLAEQPLLTRAMRQAEMEERASRYKRVVVRVQFPNRIVVQGVFQPRETVHAVYKFVRDLLEDKSSTFELYTSPPKNVLEDMTQTLIEANLVPMTRVYFGFIPHRSDISLKTEVLGRVSSRSSAEEVISKHAPDKNTPIENTEKLVPKRTAPKSEQGKSVPKWFQSSKK